MSRVMLVCPEPLHGRPAGIGIRFMEMARVLRADGHSVTMLSPDGGGIGGIDSAITSPESLQSISARADVAVVQGHVINDFIAHAHPIPTAVDLYDPFIIENLHYYDSRGGEVFSHDHLTLMNSVARGDVFLCASQAQRLFYLGVMLAAGRLNPVSFGSDPHLDSLLRIAPFGVQPPREVPSRELQRPAILFGGIYDWYDPILAIDAVALVREELPQVTLSFNSHPNPEFTPQGKAAEALAYVERRGYEFVKFVPWVAYDDRAPFFDRHALALLTFPQSLETDLSMRTRIYDYLWGGLPVVTSSAPGTDELLTRFQCGSIAREHSPRAFADAMLRILRDRQRHTEMVNGTRAFVEEHQWSRTLGPLVDFCRSPSVDQTKDAFGVKLQLPPEPASILKRIKRRIGGRP